MILPGQYFDFEGARHQNGYRDYIPRTGRYLQSDPIGLAGGINTYAYVGSNPLKYVDPLGLLRTPDFYSVSVPTPVPYVGVSITVDRYGEVYAGPGAGIGMPVVGASVGWLPDKDKSLQESQIPTSSALADYLSGLAGMMGFGIGLNWNLTEHPEDNRQALLLTTPSIGASYAWELGNLKSVLPSCKAQ